MQRNSRRCFAEHPVHARQAYRCEFLSVPWCSSSAKTQFIVRHICWPCCCFHILPGCFLPRLDPEQPSLEDWLGEELRSSSSHARPCCPFRRHQERVPWKHWRLWILHWGEVETWFRRIWRYRTCQFLEGEVSFLAFKLLSPLYI